jgi:hypothetical protein
MEGRHGNSVGVPPPPLCSDMFDFALDLSKKSLSQQTECKKVFSEKKELSLTKEDQRRLSYKKSVSLS